MNSGTPLNSVSRSETRIVANNLPYCHIGQLLNDAFGFALRIKPPIDDNVIMVEVSPSLRILDAVTHKELHKFATSTNFSFSGLHSKFRVVQLTYQVIVIALNEFNNELAKLKSTLSLHRKIECPTVSEIEKYVSDALQSKKYREYNIKPAWLVTSSGTEEKNQNIINRLPLIPLSKQFFYQGEEYRPNNKPTTPEGESISKLFLGEAPTDQDLKILQESIDFYNECFPLLSEIDLTHVSDQQANDLENYFRNVFSTSMYLSNDISNQNMFFRVTRICENFLDNGKVRETKFLTHPTVEILQKKGVYNRASSPSRALLYVSESENTALREASPGQNEKIIITTWINHSSRPLIAYPLSLAAGIQNSEIDKATQAVEQLCEGKHPILVSWIELIQSFITSAFIKRCTSSHPKKYEYLYSAYIGDKMLQAFPEVSKVKSFDCILYPSVAGLHATNNLAIVPETVKNCLSIICAEEYQVIDTCYDKEIVNDNPPAVLKIIRKSKSIIDGRIFWDDDDLS